MLEICSLSVLVLHEILLVPVLMYDSETMLLKEKEKSRVRNVQMDNFRGLLGRWIESEMDGEGSYAE